MKSALIITPLFATLLLATPALAHDTTGDASEPRMNKKEMAEKLAKKVDPVAAPPRQTKGISLPTTDPQDPTQPEEPVEEGTPPEEPKKEEALHHLRKAYD